jgi:hypothetical protein
MFAAPWFFPYFLHKTLLRAPVSAKPALLMAIAAAKICNSFCRWRVVVRLALHGKRPFL